MIALNGTKPIDGTQQWVFLTVNNVDGEECLFTHIAPADLAGQALQDYVDGKEDDYKLDILKDMYPGAVVTPTEDQTVLEAFEAWITAGHKNNIEVNGEQIETVIAKVPWKGDHPMIETGITVLEFRQLFTLSELVAIKTSTDPVIGVFVDDLSVAVRVHLDHPRVLEGMNYLVSQGLITESRKQEILS